MTNEIKGVAKVSGQDTAIAAVIERAVMDKDVDMTKLEKMLDMQERIFDKNAEIEFNRAFSEMQADMPAITEKGEIAVNGLVRSTYAKFEDINKIIKPILQNHGFGVSFRTTMEEKMLTVTCVLMHKGGHREQNSLPLPFDSSGSKNAVQAIGSSSSYGKRYTLCGILNISTGGEDDDAQSAEPVPAVTEDQAANIKAILSELGEKVEGTFLNWIRKDYKAVKIEEIPADQYNRVIHMLESKRKQA